ncbi:MAG: hypothetical protein RBR66_04880, partial [Candidatus Izemoplasmatales bacterium]|nr:hypothetical protein [Candidatus Izemoplasmatales bacterium]
MSRLKNFLEKLKKKSKLEILKSLFQSFSVTVVAVVAVVVFVPNSPKANFDNIKVFSHEIIYQVSVTDEDNAIKGNQLKIVLEDQFGKQEQLISLGQNYGSFSSLKPLTEYKLKVVYDKGFGEEVLAQETVKTDTDLIAAITNFSSYQDPMMQEEHYFIYNLEIAYGNIEGYTNFNLRYTTVFPEYPDELYYEYYPLLNNETSAQLYFYGSYGAVFQIFLEADFEGQTVIVDEIIMNAPFNLVGSFYIDYFNNTEISFYTFVNHIENIEEIECFIDLYQAETLIKSIDYIPEDIETTEEIPIVIDGLEPVSDYTLVLRANYINPDTLKKEEKNVYSFSFTTLKNSVAEITNFTQYIDPYFEEQYISVYNVEIAYGKTSGYSDFQLRYATINPMYPEETYYEIYPLTYLNTIAQLQFYNAQEAKYHLILEAMYNGEMVIIDEVEVDAPFMVSGSMDINTIDATEVLVNVYDVYIYSNGPTVTYSIDLYQSTALIETITYLPVEQSVLISNLEPLTPYQLVLRANYINPDTSIAEEKILSEVSFTTATDIVASITSFTQYIDPQNPNDYISIYDVVIAYENTIG